MSTDRISEMKRRAIVETATTQTATSATTLVTTTVVAPASSIVVFSDTATPVAGSTIMQSRRAVRWEIIARDVLDKCLCYLPPLSHMKVIDHVNKHWRNVAQTSRIWTSISVATHDWIGDFHLWQWILGIGPLRRSQIRELCVDTNDKNLWYIVGDICSVSDWALAMKEANFRTMSRVHTPPTPQALLAVNPGAVVVKDIGSTASVPQLRDTITNFVLNGQFTIKTLDSINAMTSLRSLKLDVTIRDDGHDGSTYDTISIKQPHLTSPDVSITDSYSRCTRIACHKWKSLTTLRLQGRIVPLVLPRNLPNLLECSLSPGALNENFLQLRNMHMTDYNEMASAVMSACIPHSCTSLTLSHPSMNHFYELSQYAAAASTSGHPLALRTLNIHCMYHQSSPKFDKEMAANLFPHLHKFSICVADRVAYDRVNKRSLLTICLPFFKQLKLLDLLESTVSLKDIETILDGIPTLCAIVLTNVKTIPKEFRKRWSVAKLVVILWNDDKIA